MKANSLFSLSNKTIIGVIHVQALPGTPDNRLSVKEITEQALAEAQLYENSGLDAIMIENMHDVPYLNDSAGPEIISSMSVIASAVRDQTKLPIGIQILAGANKAALAVAYSCDLNFIRVENFAYAHIADEGLMQSCAGHLLRYRKYLEAQNIAILTDVKKKHASHALTSDISIEEAVKTYQFFKSDGIIITGSSTGVQPRLEDLSKAKYASTIPVIIGSGITLENIRDYWDLADAFIIGSYFKQEGIWSNPISPRRLTEFMELAADLKKTR